MVLITPSFISNTFFAFSWCITPSISFYLPFKIMFYVTYSSKSPCLGGKAHANSSWSTNFKKVFFKNFKIIFNYNYSKHSCLLNIVPRTKSRPLICLWKCTIGLPLSLIMYGLMPPCKFYSLKKSPFTTL